MADPTAARLIDELRRFTAERWAGEPADVTRLRGFSLPPMGTMPCVLYCNFDLFWAGEQLQVSANTLHVALAIPEDEAERLVTEGRTER